MSNDNDSEFLYPAGDPKIRKAWEELGKKYPIKYNKLVRDKITEIIIKNGGLPKGRILVDDKKFWESLKNKLMEEVQELLAAKTREEQAEEFGDVQDVIDKMQALLGFTKKEINNLRRKKARVKGKFDKRIFLESA